MSKQEPTIRLKPSYKYPLPVRDEDEVPHDMESAMRVAANTANLLNEMGVPLALDTKEEAQKAKRLFKEVLADRKLEHLKSMPVAYASAQFLKIYAQQAAFDAVKIRAALTNKLLEIANCGDIKYELRAIELLGKHSDIGLFTERSEVTIKHSSPDELEKSIKDRVRRLLDADYIDVKPLSVDTEEELGLKKKRARQYRTIDITPQAVDEGPN